MTSPPSHSSDFLGGNLKDIIILKLRMMQLTKMELTVPVAYSFSYFVLLGTVNTES